MRANSILVVAAHPDDEVLGCGGTIAKLTALKAVVNVAFMADGVSSRAAGASLHASELAARRAAADDALRTLGARAVFFGDLPDNRMDTVAMLEITQRVEALLDQYRPDTVFTHHGGDLNVDHRRTCAAVLTACRPLPGQMVRTILSFEVPSSTEWQLPHAATAFLPNWFVDISATLERKVEALARYSAEARAWPHARSLRAVESLARWRGASVGAEAAEAFMLVRELA
jgi:LmbE family N-acetylglucosaminyl deacetylase